MRKFVALSVIAISLGFAACNSDKKTEQEIDSLNQSAADSLLNAALADSTVLDSAATDSIPVH